jgi:hypothetical protein
VIQHDFGQEALVALAVDTIKWERLHAEGPENEDFALVALTVFQEPGENGFRIGATNLMVNFQLTTLIVQWWLLAP